MVPARSRTLNLIPYGQIGTFALVFVTFTLLPADIMRPAVVIGILSGLVVGIADHVLGWRPRVVEPQSWRASYIFGMGVVFVVTCVVALVIWAL
ncbi:MAG: hypothetical protein WKF80_02115 [Thermomicrobiales bacterium]